MHGPCALRVQASALVLTSSLTQAKDRGHRACRLRSPLGYSMRTLDDTLNRAHGLRESESGHSLRKANGPSGKGRAGPSGAAGWAPGRCHGPSGGRTRGPLRRPDPTEFARRPTTFRSSNETQPTVTLHEHSVLSARWPPTLSASRSGSSPAPLTRRTERVLLRSPSWPSAVPCETVAKPCLGHGSRAWAH